MKKVVPLALLVMGCCLSCGGGEESKLLGEWQATSPRAVSLRVEARGSYNDGYHDGFSYTRDGSSYVAYWRMKHESRGTILYLSSGSPGGGTGFGVEGLMQATALPHRIIELTSRKLVLEWDTRSDAQSSGTAVYEFLRPSDPKLAISTPTAPVGEAVQPATSSEKKCMGSTIAEPKMHPVSCVVNAPEGGEVPDEPSSSSAPSPRSQSTTTMATASSILPPEGRFSYEPSEAINTVTSGAWCEGVRGAGIGESIALSFGAPRSLTTIALFPGYPRTEQGFLKNNRLRAVKLLVSDATESLSFDWHFDGSYRAATFAFPKELRAKTLRIEIRDVYSGRVNDTCIGGIVLR